nr:PREDICTED: threonine aspartase 1-like [Phalacrocorax carbo]
MVILCMIMEKGISSVEVLPSKSSQVTAVKVVVKEPETKQIQRGKRVGFVLVHAGAGYHSESKAKEYKHVCKRACQKAIEKLQAGALATDAVTAALIELEDSPFTNAGLGSNLNLLGEIECDASIMDGKSLNFGAVGALSGIKNPVSVANRLLCEGQKGKLSAGRIPPCDERSSGNGKFRGWALDWGGQGGSWSQGGPRKRRVAWQHLRGRLSRPGVATSNCAGYLNGP